MNTLIAIPSMDEVPAAFAQALAMLEKVGNTAVAFQIGSLVYTSRNKLAQTSIEMDADFVLWLDSDMVFEPNLLVHMMRTMEEHNIDILCGPYYKRVAPYKPVLYDTLRIEGNGCQYHGMDEVPSEGLFKVDACGFGCVLMRAEVIISVLGKHAQTFNPINAVGEDLSFCWRARDCGYEIWCDPSIKLGHIGRTVITRDFFNAYRGAKNAE